MSWNRDSAIIDLSMYEYDDFRVTFRARSGGGYEVTAVFDGRSVTDAFVVPLSDSELTGAVLRIARSHAQWRVRRATSAALVDGLTDRDVGGSAEAVAIEAKRLGEALGSALFGGGIGDAYERALAQAAARSRGLRLCLSLADTPALLSLPWEFLFRRPRYLAAGLSTPTVRLLDLGPYVTQPPPAVRSRVRVLGVVSNPVDLPPLEVDDERRRIDAAMRGLGDLVEVAWVQPATPRGLRTALLDGGGCHVLHYIGHGSFTSDGRGALYLEREADRRAVRMDETLLANLLAFHVDRQLLRLVVLNTCQGARTSLTDPFAGVATTLVRLGVPAVVAMQFEISDDAARLFAEEFYTDLVKRQMPIDMAVAAARKAILVDLDPLEWATPVLFVRDPNVELFSFDEPPGTTQLGDARDAVTARRMSPRQRLRRLFDRK